MSKPDSPEELKEKLAAIEHQRWSDWMEYMLDCGVKSGDDNIGIRTVGWPTKQFENWQRQIETDYADLTRKEQLSDLEQVERYWTLVEEYYTNKFLEIVGEDFTNWGELTTEEQHEQALLNDFKFELRQAIKQLSKRGE